MPEARGGLPLAVDLAPTAAAAIARADVVVLTIPWDEYRELPAATWARTAAHPRVVVDCWRALGHLASQEGVRYVPLGVGPGADPADNDPGCFQR
jgi:predicted dinucleotide-binding enzyme